jgi:hypothetical protein
LCPQAGYASCEGRFLLMRNNIVIIIIISKFNTKKFIDNGGELANSVWCNAQKKSINENDCIRKAAAALLSVYFFNKYE